MFWDIEQHAGSGRSLFDGASGQEYSYARLLQSVQILEGAFRADRKQMLALFCDNSVASVAAYLAGLRCGHAVLLANADMDPGLQRHLIDQYAPERVVHATAPADIPAGYVPKTEATGLTVLHREQPVAEKIHPDLAVLLSTSGSTGSPKLIRLSGRNLQANAESIAEYLGIGPDENAIASLPFSYSYGLSVLNSHVLKGAGVVCTNASVMTREFWTLFNGRECTSFAGVPFTYAMLERLRFERMELPSLRTFTQAGGRLDAGKIQWFAEVAQRKNARFFVMYGQTEATARIAYVPWPRLPEKIGSVGIAIPRGRIRIVADGGAEAGPGQPGEVVYEGPNVMMGYAESRKCLAKGDELHGRLATGDMGHVDQEGFLYITGRMKRFLKLFGLRINLDDVEKMLEKITGCQVACVGTDDALHALLATEDADLPRRAKEEIAGLYRLHHSVVHVHPVSAMPVTASGKKDYPRIEREYGLQERD